MMRYRVIPPPFVRCETEEEWFRYYSQGGGKAAGRALRLQLREQMRRRPNALSFDSLKAAIEALNGHYTDDVLRQFHTGLNYLDDKHFVIVAGVSGTGKTSLAKRYAYAVHGISNYS